MTNNLKKQANNAIKRAAGQSNVPKKNPEHPLINAINQQLPAVKKLIKQDPEKFIRIVVTTTKQNPRLLSCDPQSFLGAMMESAAFNLEPNTKEGLAYLIPYGNEVQFQLGYKGLIKMAYRTGHVKKIYAHTVYENEPFEIELGVHKDIKTHIPLPPSQRGNIIGYYAVIVYDDGYRDFEFAYAEEIKQEAQKNSKSFNNGPWKYHFSSMAKAWVIKRLLKYANISDEVNYAISNDGQVTNINEEILQSDHLDHSQIFNAPAEYIQEETEIIDVVEEDTLEPSEDDPFPEQQRFA